MMMLQPRKNNAMDLFDSMFDDSFFAPARSLDKMIDKCNAQMRCDITEENGNYVIAVDMPGYDKKDVSVELKNGYLMVSASKSEEKEENKDNKKNYIHRERYYGSCSRSFYVGDGVKEENVKAAFENGTLKLTLPKTEPEKEEHKLINID